MANTTLITQNGKILATLQENETVILHTDDRKLNGDISIQFGTDGEISYQNKTIKVPMGKTATIKCNGLIVTEDIIVKTFARTVIPELDPPVIVLVDYTEPQTLKTPTIVLVEEVEPEQPRILDTPRIFLMEDVVHVLGTPTIFLTDDTEPEEPTYSSILGEAALGYLILGPDAEEPTKLQAPVIYLYDQSDIISLDTPIIQIVDVPNEPVEPIHKLDTPVISIIEVTPQILILDTPIIHIEDSEAPSYVTEANETGTTIILYNYTEELNDDGITIIIA